MEEVTITLTRDEWYSIWAFADNHACEYAEPLEAIDKLYEIIREDKS